MQLCSEYTDYACEKERGRRDGGTVTSLDLICYSRKLTLSPPSPHLPTGSRTDKSIPEQEWVLPVTTECRHTGSCPLYHLCHVRICMYKMRVHVCI